MAILSVSLSHEKYFCLDNSNTNLLSLLAHKCMENNIEFFVADLRFMHLENEEMVRDPTKAIEIVQ